MNNSNITLNDEDMECNWYPETDEHCIVIHTNKFGMLANDIIKQQILENQQNIERVNDLMVELDIDNLELFCANAITHKNIVERLKEKIKEIYDNYPHEYMKENGGIERTNSDYIILKSILEKQA